MADEEKGQSVAVDDTESAEETETSSEEEEEESFEEYESGGEEVAGKVDAVEADTAQVGLRHQSLDNARISLHKITVTTNIQGGQKPGAVAADMDRRGATVFLAVISSTAVVKIIRNTRCRAVTLPRRDTR